MTDALNNALWITLIGMGLVFIAILLLWGLMALIVRIFAEREAPVQAVEEPSAAQPAALAQSASPADGDRKRRAAAAAVAVALAVQHTARQPRSKAPNGALSPWQSVHRAGQLSQRVYTSRKKVV